MFKSMKNRVEEDLERIKNANMPYYMEPKNAAERAELAVDNPVESDEPEKLTLEPLDIPAMLIAFFLAVVPFIAIFLGLMGLIVFGIYMIL